MPQRRRTALILIRDEEQTTTGNQLFSLLYVKYFLNLPANCLLWKETFLIGPRQAKKVPTKMRKMRS